MEKQDMETIKKKRLPNTPLRSARSDLSISHPFAQLSEMHGPRHKTMQKKKKFYIQHDSKRNRQENNRQQK